MGEKQIVRDKFYYLGLENQSNSMTSLSNAPRTSTASDKQWGEKAWVSGYVE